ncbi:glucokinase [Microvirga sp. 2TAF3]|uniref:glucokinase n=1 Tax=Microvirga sp. 2TAF3 TaxID=3233014 RepID=UPI003F991D21
MADIGGTYSRYAVLPAPSGPLSRLITIATTRHATPSVAIRSALKALGAPSPRSALLGVAGCVNASSVRLTNAPWNIDAARIGADLSLSSVMLINDYVPVAAALPLIDIGQPGECTRIGPSIPCGEGTLVALGPGTGLGAAACIPVQDRYWLQPTEAGHMDFGACETDELAIWPLIERAGGRITAETVLSGPGLVRLYRAAVRRIGRKPPSCTPAEVIAAASSGGNEAASEAVRLFLSLLGRFAGDLALIFNATGGVYFGSGILPRIVDLLDRGGFRLAFERKAPFESVMARIPTFVISRPEPAMSGLMSIVSAPDRFVFQAHGWSEDPSRFPLPGPPSPATTERWPRLYGSQP